jgi:hypothetical protein
MKRLLPALLLTLSILSAPATTLAWHSTGHKLVAKIAWDNMTPKARQNVVDLLLQAPKDACLKQLFSKGTSATLDKRQRDFFVVVATWPDIVRPQTQSDGSPDPRPCTKYHRRDWHFVDHFWKGTSGSATDPPTDLPMPIAQVNAVERLGIFGKAVVSNTAAADRAIDLAWILHLVGDIHQPLHTSGRVTNFSHESDGDAGGNEFLLKGDTLHGFWDGIVDNLESSVGINKLSENFEADFPRANFTNLESGQFERWAFESLEKAKTTAYPAKLKRGVTPSKAYRTTVFNVSEEAIADAGYRLADLLNKLFG